LCDEKVSWILTVLLANNELLFLRVNPLPSEPADSALDLWKLLDTISLWVRKLMPLHGSGIGQTNQISSA